MFSFSICLVRPSLGVREDSLVGECLKSRAAYNQWLGNSLGNQHTHTFWTLSFLCSHRNTTLKDYRFRVSSLLQDSRQTALRPQRKGPKSPHSVTPTQFFWSFRYPPAKPAPELQALGSRAQQRSNPCTEPPSNRTALHNTTRLKYYLQIFPHFSFLLQNFSATGSAEGSTTNMAPRIFSSLAKCFEIRDVYLQSLSKDCRTKSSCAEWAPVWSRWLPL